ncbi:hypothetical protein [Streptomyces sp. AC627_RSS907]|uniref:hypothetical protein n=1 Tax=Streptomyces sp. AC627_RSS907 TaxID=2823684 RepID=UPI001C2467BC|nr:hypothetical protein [Streptomyces sp. AC627_RSS907]
MGHGGRQEPGDGYEQYRDDLRLVHLVSVEAGTGRLVSVRMVPLRVRRMRLEHAPEGDCAWLGATLARISDGVDVVLEPSGTLVAVSGRV